MLLCMRTTVILPDELYRQVKQRALEAGQSVTSFMETALRQEILRRDVTPTQIVDFSSNAGLYDALDAGEPLEKLR